MLTATRLRVLRARRATVAAVASNSFVRQTSFNGPRLASGRVVFGEKIVGTRHFASSATRREEDPNAVLERLRKDEDGDAIPAEELTSVGSHEQQHEHAVISTFDLFSIGGMFTICVTIPTARIGCLIVGA